MVSRVGKFNYWLSLRCLYESKINYEPALLRYLVRTTLLEQSIKLTFNPATFTEEDVSGVRLVSAHKAGSFREGSIWHSETIGSAGAENIPSLVISAA